MSDYESHTWRNGSLGGTTELNGPTMQAMDDAVALAHARATALEEALPEKADTSALAAKADNSALSAAIAAVPEQARDAVGAALVQGANITITVSDAGDTITIAASGGTPYTDEMAQDAIAALFQADTQTGITFTYDDAGNALSATVAAPSWSSVTGKPSFAAVATSGAFSDLTGAPSFPAATSGDEGRTLQVVGGSLALTQDSGAVPLKRFRQALAMNYLTTLKWWAIGDSISEGQKADILDNGYGPAMLRALQKRCTDAGKGGFGYLNTNLQYNFDGSAGGLNYWTFTGGSGMTATYIQTPWGGKRWTAAAGGTATLTFTGTSFILAYRQGDATSIPFTVTVDGGSSVTITPATTGGFSVRGQYTSPTMASGVHNVVIAPVNPAQTMWIYGATLLDGDETGGIRYYNHAFHGATTTSYLSSFGSFADQGALAANPALVTIHLGTNDYGLNVDPALTLTNLQAIIANVKSACTITPSFLLIVPSQQGGIGSPAFPWSSYVAAIKAVAAADPTNVAVLDLTDHFIDTPAAGNNNTHNLINPDLTHPSKGGHRFTAQLMLARLMGAHQALG